MSSSSRFLRNKPWSALRKLIWRPLLSFVRVAANLTIREPKTAAYPAYGLRASRPHRSSLSISLAVKGNQVHGLRRRCVQLSQHRGDLSTFTGEVIDQVLQHLPKHVRLVITAKFLILDRECRRFRHLSCELIALLAFQFCQ